MLKRLQTKIKKNIAEYYILSVLIIFIPLSISLLTSIKWGLLTSFITQAIIGILYIKGKTE